MAMARCPGRLGEVLVVMVRGTVNRSVVSSGDKRAGFADVLLVI